MEATTSVLDSFDRVFERFELCTKKELFKICFFLISFILGTVDLVTDWINYIQWSSLGGYDQYYFMYIFQTAFLCAAVAGTILWTVEVFLMIKRSQEAIRNYQKRSNSKKMDKWKRTEHTSSPSRVGFTVRLLIGLMEDLPVVILIFCSLVIPFCGVLAKQEKYSVTTIVTVASSMLNSMWTMFVLYWDLCGCNKKVSNSQCCCTVIRSLYEQTSLCVCYCGYGGCVTTSSCGCLCLDQSRVDKSRTETSETMVKSRCKQIAFLIGKSFLLVFIFLLYLAIFFLGGITFGLLFGTSASKGWGLVDAEHTRSIKTDRIGPGLDSRTDAAMFVTMVYTLPNWYHVGLYDNRNVNIAKSASVKQIQNRLYIGQFSELERLKDGILTKAIPCRRAFSFLEIIDELIFHWNDLQNLNTNLSNCKIIFQLKYYPTNNNWNPFINFIHLFFKYITVEWGIYVRDYNTCPAGLQALPVSSLLTETLKRNIVNYTCSPPCINATDVCRQASYGKFGESGSKTLSTAMTGEPRLYLTVNDQQKEDSCDFRTIFVHSTGFCDKLWADVQPVTVPDFVKQLYPQFITIPMTYKKKIKTNYLFLDSKCSKIWAEGEKIWF